MSASGSAGRDRVVRSRRRPSSGGAAALAALDRRVLEVLCTHRVVTQEQLGRLFPEVPERTLRYRTRRLHELGLAGRSRPYRERGSAPNHHWPTRHADCLMRGDAVPRGGERRQPNPSFLAHAAALSDLYVAFVTGAEAVGLCLRGYWREGEARERFERGGREHAIAPDARVLLLDGAGRELLAFVEIDLGTMSHTRLRQKAELYAAYVEAAAWEGRHRFLPALLFLTTSDVRAVRFLKALEGVLSFGRRRPGRRAFVVAAGGLALTPGRLLGERCLADLDGNTGVELVEVLGAARDPYERAVAYWRERREAEAERRRVLYEDCDAMREHLRREWHALASYIDALGPQGESTLALLVAVGQRRSVEEQGVLRAIAEDLGNVLLEPRMHELPQPSAVVVGEVALLTEHYRAIQRGEIEALAQRHKWLPYLRLAWRLLKEGGLLDAEARAQLPHDVEQNLRANREQRERCTAYLQARELTARQLVKRSGPLGRLGRRPEEFYEQIDRERLRVCSRCREVIFPGTSPAGDYSDKPSLQCHYCRDRSGTEPYRGPTPSTESDGQP